MAFNSIRVAEALTPPDLAPHLDLKPPSQKVALLALFASHIPGFHFESWERNGDRRARVGVWGWAEGEQLMFHSFGLWFCVSTVYASRFET